MTLKLGPADLNDPQLRDLVAAHRAHAFATTEPANVFALDADALREPGLEMVTAHRGDALMGIGGLRHLDAENGEIKSVHVAEAARGQGIGQQIISHLIARAREAGLRHLWLETGSMEAYAPSRALYSSAGFVVCGSFGDYPDHPGSAFMTKAL